MFKKLTASIFASLSIFAPTSAFAERIEEHQFLWETLGRIGVERYVNHPDYCSKSAPFSGLYHPGLNVLVICQDYAESMNGEMVNWTSNDLDTLRHEAHHIVQDCSASTLEDEQMDLMFNDEELKEFISNSGITREKLQWIADNYRQEFGASDDIILKEFEAFSVALSVDPITIANKLVEYCGLR